MSFSTIKEPCKEGCRPYSPLKIVNQTKFSARGAAYLCKVTIAARSPYGRPPARRVGIALPVRRRRGVCRRGVYRAAVGCTVPPWGAPSSRAEVERAPAQVAPFPLVGLDRCFRCLTGSRAEVERAPAQVAYSP